MFESVFRTLFKYQPLVFEQGDFVWGVSRWMSVVVVAAAGAAVYALFTYRGLAGRAPRDRVVLLGLRLATIGLLVACLFRPMLVLKVAVPQQNFVGVLLDDSKSMQIADHGEHPRSSYIEENFANKQSALMAKLSEKFVVRTFKFSSVAERVPSATGLTYAGTGTRLGDALDRARDELAGLPLSGLVVITDGADTSDAVLDDPIAALKAESIPVFPIGVGEERMSKDIQISRVQMPRSVLKGAALVVDVVVAQAGYANAKLPLIVESEGRIVSTQEIAMPAEGQAQTVRVRFTASETGSRRFKVRIPAQSGEQVVENNAREQLIEVVDRREKILYIEGEPRFEAKFVRQAVETDPNLQVVLLQRTAAATPASPAKFLRLGVDTPDELIEGFPLKEEDLFAYRGLILGSVEASAFTVEQLRMLSDFVSRRGGGFLALGGRRAFGEGGWSGTPVGDALPVAFDSSRAPSPLNELAVEPARAGLTHPVTQLADTEAASLERWDKLPVVTSVNPIRRLKPGASVLLSGADPRGTDHIVLASQKFGRGKSLAFAVQDSWLWRMHASMPVADTTHHQFWQRLLRWVVDDVPGRVEITTAPDAIEPGEPVTVSAWVTDKKYVDVNDGKVVATVKAPSGKLTEVPMAWTVKRDGEYQATFTPAEPGLHEVRVAASRTSEDLGGAVAHVLAAPSDREYFDAGMRATLLSRLAEETGGKFYRSADTKTLADALTFSGRGVTVVEEKDLWDMPVVLLMLVALTGGEWVYRRARGLA